MNILETHIVPAIAQEIRLQEYAPRVFKNISTRSGIKKAIKKGLILLNGEPANTSDWIKQGQKLELLQQEVSPGKVFKLPLQVIYEDEFIAIINKPSGCPTSGNYFKTVQNALPFNLKSSEAQDKLPFPLPAHRLDNPTSGILLCAKTRTALLKLQQAFKEKNVKKTYVALCHGKVPEHLRISEDIENKSAVTRLERLNEVEIKNERFSLVKLWPETGRTHQLRIHLAKIGNPIVGDPIYGQEEKTLFSGKSLYLTSTGTSFLHPTTSETLTFEIPLSKKFRKFKDSPASP